MWSLKHAKRVAAASVCVIGCGNAAAGASAQIRVEQMPEVERVTIPKVARAPRLDDFIEPRPNAGIVTTMAKIDGFIQRAPDDGQPATQATEVYLAYDERRLHVVFVAHDTEPHKLRARLDKREFFGLDEDQVGIYLDTFHDRRR